nr:WD and tetratricopeptide repeats protein 1-like [Leptinotarsa decemlineata]
MFSLSRLYLIFLLSQGVRCHRISEDCLNLLTPMGDKLRKWRYRRDFLKLLHSRENNAEASKFLKMHSQFTDNLVKRLGLEYELEGHQGCVNCLEWTADGKYLASGSDDTNIILWDPFRHKKLQVIPTNHIGNIFSVKFLGRTCTELATASGDCRVLVQSINDAVTKGPPILECSCHVNRVKRLAISPIEPSLFWSAAEDGLVINTSLQPIYDCNAKELLFCIFFFRIGDLYNAARNFLHVIQYWPSKIQAYTGLIESLIELKWIEEAKKWIEYFSTLHMNNNSHPQVTLLRTKLEKLEHVNLTKEEGKDASDDKDRLPRRVDDAEYKKRLESKDFEVRFLGHCNTTTDIKEANFLGEDGNYVCAGSDEGIIFVWERKRSKIVTALFGDLSIVNCIQPHPSMCFIASSGIDSSVKLWSPLPEDDCVNPRAVTDIQAVVEANQQRMSMDPYESMMVNLGYSIYGRSVDQVQSEVVPPCRTC